MQMNTFYSSKETVQVGLFPLVLIFEQASLIRWTIFTSFFISEYNQKMKLELFV